RDSSRRLRPGQAEPMRGQGMRAGDRRGRSWRSSREFAHGGGPEAGSFPGAAQNQVARCVRGAVAKALDIEVFGPPTVADDFSSGTTRVSNEEIGLEGSHVDAASLVGLRHAPPRDCRNPVGGGATETRTPRAPLVCSKPRALLHPQLAP